MAATPVLADADQTKSEYDPDFMDMDDDLELVSSDGIHYRIHPAVLRKASGCFRDMFTIPNANPGEPILLTEPSQTLGPLFHMVSGLEVPVLSDLDLVDNILEAASKYQMPGPQSVIRQLLLASSGGGVQWEDPLKLYVVACQFDLADLAQAASTRTLDVDIHAEEYRASLSRLSARNRLALQDVRRTRRDMLDKLFDGLYNKTQRLSGFQCGICSQGYYHSSNEAYRFMRDLQAYTFREMDRRPSGTGLRDYIENCSFFTGASNFSCYHKKYDTIERTPSDILSSVIRFVEQLPVKIV